MFKTTFVFDTFLEKRENDYYGMTLTYDFFSKRYLKEFDRIKVVTRVKNKEQTKGNTDGYKITNGKNVEVDPIIEYKNISDALLKHKSIKNSMEKIISESDIIIIRMPSVLGIFAQECAIKYKKKYFIELVACPWDGYMNHTNLAGKIIAPIMYFMTKNAVKKANNVLYVTNDFLQHRYPCKANQIGCSDVSLKKFDDQILDNRIRKINNDNNIQNTIKLCTVANVELKYKGQEYVMKAMKILEEKNINTEYFLIGGGNQERLKKIAENIGIIDKVHFIGSVSHDKVFDLLDNVDIYIQPSLQEGLPRALIEAMSRGCPAIGFKTGGIPELIQREFVLKRKDYKSISEKIEVLLNKDIRKKIASENFEKSKLYEEESLNTKRNKFYENVKNENIG